MSNSERIKEKLRKLLELARQGVGGEKDNAQSVLDKLLKKHDLTLDDLDPDFAPVELCEFSFDDKLERDLLLQVTFSVLQTNSIMRRKERGNSKKLRIKMTKAQYLEVDLAFGLYREAFKKEQRRLYLAFVHKNNLVGQTRDDDTDVQSKPSELSKEDVDAIISMMGAIKTTNVRKALS